MPWEIADRDHPERAGPRYADLARASRVCELASPAERFFLRWIGPGKKMEPETTREDGDRDG